MKTRVDARWGAPARLWWALGFVVMFHGSLLLSGSFRGTYDAYVHIFLADHYARDWFSTWDQRWYTGFTTVSYPPGTHQAVGALSMVFDDLGRAFVVVQLFALINLCIGVYRFSLLWVDRRAAGTAALLFAVSSSIAETIHVFGQLPTTFSLAFLLNASPFLYRWAFGGKFVDLGRGVVVLAACTAGHHVTTLFGSVFFIGPVLLAGLIDKSREPHPDEPPGEGSIAVTRSTLGALVARRIRRVLPSTVRLAVLGPAVLTALVGVVLPYWIWSGSDPINQVSIPHGSRNNFWVDRNIGLVFFLIPWGLLLPIVPVAVFRAALDRRWPLAASIGLLFLLGTGGTTPIPALLLGPAFHILTLDRFTFWGSIAILPLAATIINSLEDGTISVWLRRFGGRLLSRGLLAGYATGLLAVAVLSSNLGQFRPFQPTPIDPDPIVAFIEKDEHDRWRFMTLGFGDQMAWLSAQTTATQVDGNYHSARRLPELTSTSVERLEGAKYRGVSGLGSLQQFLEFPEKYQLKYVFSNDEFYDPLLYVSGWQHIGTLENGIDVWERADIAPLPALLPAKEKPNWQRIMWGVVPPTAIVSALVLLVGTAVLALARGPAEPGPKAGLIWPLSTIDRRLGRRAATLPPADGEPRIGWGTRLLSRIRRRAVRPISTRTRLARAVILVSLVLTPFVLASMSSSEPEGPDDVVAAYYDDLDFRRFRSAYDRLDPETRPSYEMWRAELSVVGGLLSSYAKLDSIEVEIVDEVTDRASVHADLEYITALDWYPVDRAHDLVRRDGRWLIEAAPADIRLVPSQLIRRSDVSYDQAGRRRVLQESTELIDVQDRPTISITEARLVERDGLPTVVGHVVNGDVDPADITITAVLYDSDDVEIARYNLTEHGLRTLNPGEGSAFRVDFEEVAAGQNLDFDPLDVQPLSSDADIASVDLLAKAVVTTGNLYRGVATEALTVTSGPDDTVEVSTRLRNNGTTEAILPVVFVTFLDDEGRVLWVERHYVSESIRPQRWVDVEFSVPEPLGIEDHPAETTIYDNGVSGDREGRTAAQGSIPAPPGASYDRVVVDVVTMTADGS